jgi:hypothetical protein
MYEEVKVKPRLILRRLCLCSFTQHYIKPLEIILYV